jgi:hypothetical protein
MPKRPSHRPSMVPKGAAKVNHRLIFMKHIDADSANEFRVAVINIMSRDDYGSSAQSDRRSSPVDEGRHPARTRYLGSAHNDPRVYDCML